LVSLFQTLKAQASISFPNSTAELLYEIRVGNEIYSGPLDTEFWQLYNRRHGADYIRVVVQASTNQTGQPQPQIEAQIALVLDRNSENQSRLDASGLHPNVTWVSGAFSRFDEILANAPSRNSILHSLWFEMAVQLTVVLFITSFAIFATTKLQGLVELEFDAVYIFIVVFLLLSNVWTYGVRALQAARGHYYPVVDIRQEPRKRWLPGALVFVALSAAAWAIGYVLDLFAN
jgi:hypothetical protein